MSGINAHGGHTRYSLVTPQLMPVMLYVFLGTMRKHSPASGEDVCKILTFTDDSTRVFVHLKNKHTDT